MTHDMPPLGAAQLDGPTFSRFTNGREFLTWPTWTEGQPVENIEAVSPRDATRQYAAAHGLPATTDICVSACTAHYVNHERVALPPPDVEWEHVSDVPPRHG